MRKFLQVNDYEHGEDGVTKLLYEVIKESDTLETHIEIMSGDDYHDKIDYCLEGFFHALDYLKVPSTIEYKDINDDDCEDYE